MSWSSGRWRPAVAAAVVLAAAVAVGPATGVPAPAVTTCLPAQLVVDAFAYPVTVQTRTGSYRVTFAYVVARNVSALPCLVSGVPLIKLTDARTGKPVAVREQRNAGELTATAANLVTQVLMPGGRAQIPMEWQGPWCHRPSAVKVTVQGAAGAFHAPQTVRTPSCVRGNGLLSVQHWFVDPT